MATVVSIHTVFQGDIVPEEDVGQTVLPELSRADVKGSLCLELLKSKALSYLQ